METGSWLASFLKIR